MLDPTEIIDGYLVADRSSTHVRANFIASIDGAANRGGLSGGLNNVDDRLVFQILRMLSDVVLVGAGTVRSEGYHALRMSTEAMAWRRERGLADHPVLAVVTKSLDLDPQADFLVNAPRRPLVLSVDPGATQRAGELAEVADVIPCGTGQLDPLAVIRVLRELELTQVLCEGGPQLFSTMLAAGAIDEMCLTISPFLEGGPSGRIATSTALASQRMRRVQVLEAGDMLMLRYVRHDHQG